MHFWVHSAVEGMFDDFTIEEGSIKRNIRMDLINEEYYSELKMADEVCVEVEAMGGKLTGNVNQFATQPLATIEAFQRNENKDDDSFGNLMLGQDGNMRKSLGMNEVCVNTVVSMLNLTIRIQKFLEEEGIIDNNPKNDKEDLNIYVGVENGKIVGRIITDTSKFKLVTYKE